ncbi:hypothetical protein SANA_00340 [Gottschalkiaceae bacterium SANA]|nr:hypothetical protein SANA_00340 [Gottschalkiaceae bacterium SANA]
MLNLMNFEWKKTWKVYVLGIVSVLLVYAYLVLQGTDNLYRGELGAGIATTLLVLLITVGSFFLLFHSISLLSVDVKEKGYLLFSTPNSAWKILGAKLAVVFLRFFIWGFMVAGIFFHMMSSLKIEELQGVLLHNVPQIIVLILISALASLFFTMTIYFLISITATVLASWRHPVLFVILAYFGLAYVVDWVAVKLGELVNLPVTFQWNVPMINEMNGFSITGAINYSAQGAVFNIVPLLFYLIIGVVYFMAAGYLLDRKLNI